MQNHNLSNYSNSKFSLSVNIEVHCAHRAFLLLNASIRICVNRASSDAYTDMVDCDPEEDEDDADNDKTNRLYEGTGENIDEGNHRHGYQA